ncbi:MAG: ABC transporter substrate-binding protein [Gemmatimonadaceae bacterium]
MMTRSVRALALLGTALLATTLMLACADAKSQSSASRDARAGAPIVIAAAWPWSAQPNLLYEKGMRLALDDANAAGGAAGRQFRLLRVDDHESVDEGRLVAQRLAAEGQVSAVIGHMQSYVTVPAAAVYDAAGIVLIAPTSTDAALTSRGYARVFRTIFTDRDAGRQMAELAKTKGVQRVGIFYIRNDYGRALSNAFEVRANALGLDIIDRQSYDPGSRGAAELEQIVRLWKERHVDGVFLAAEAGPAARIARELKRQKVAVMMFGGDALGIPPFLAEGGDAVNGIMLPTPFHPGDPRPEVQRFAAAFQKRFGLQPDALAALGYDAVQVLTHAMRVAGSPEAEKVAPVLHGLRNWKGVTGTFSFDASGDLSTNPITTVVVRNGEFTYLGAGGTSMHASVP